MFAAYPHLSGYATFNNNPIYYSDPSGWEPEPDPECVTVTDGSVGGGGSTKSSGNNGSNNNEVETSLGDKIVKKLETVLLFAPMAKWAVAAKTTEVAAVGTNTVLRAVPAELVEVSLPLQLHHFASNKHSRYTPQFLKIIKEFGLDIDGSWNKMILPHLGRHPHEYHEFVLLNMQKAQAAAKGSVDEFLRLFDLYVKQPVIKNPELLRKSGW